MLNTDLVTIARLPLYRLLGAYVITMRPYLLFVSGVTGIVGMSFVADLPWSTAIPIFLASFLSYGFGQALTDCFQTDTDALSAPYRPLTRGTISTKQVLSISLTGLSFSILIFATHAPITLPIGILAAAGLATYTPFKRRWWGGPFYNSWIVCVLALMGFLAASGGMPAENLPAGFVPTLGSVLFGYATFVLSGYFKDVEADRATGYNTLPVVAGRGISAVLCHLFAALAVVFAVMAMEEFSVAATAFLVAGALALAVGEIRLQSNRRDQDAHRAIVPVVHGYVLLLSGIACSHQPAWLIPLVLFYGAFTVVMAHRTETNQV